MLLSLLTLSLSPVLDIARSGISSDIIADLKSSGSSSILLRAYPYLLTATNLHTVYYTSPRDPYSLAPQYLQWLASMSWPSAEQSGQLLVETAFLAELEISIVTMPVGTAMIP